MAGTRLCPRCGLDYPMSVKTCPTDNIDLVKRRWKMDGLKMRTLMWWARTRKGLDEELLHNVLESEAGVRSRKDLSRSGYYRVLAYLKKLPDTPAFRNRGKRKETPHAHAA